MTFLRQLQKRENLLRILGNSAWLLGDKLLRVGLGLFVGVLVARYLGPENYGVLAFVFAYVVLLASIAAFGLDGVVVKELITNSSSTHHILGTAFIIKCLCTLTAFVVGISLSLAIDHTIDNLSLMLMIGSLAILFQAFDVIDFRFQSELNARAIVIARSGAFIATSIVKLFLLVLGAPLLFFVATPALEAAIVAVSLVLLYSKFQGRIGRWEFQRNRAAILLRTAAPLAASTIFVAATMQVDRLMLGNLIGSHAVGIYSAATLLSTVWYMVPVVIGASVAPTLTRLYETDKAHFVGKVQDVMSVLQFGSICIAFATILVADAVVYLVFGKVYSAAAPVLAIHIWTGLFVAHVSIRSRALLIEGKTQVVAWVAGFTFLSNITLNWLLIGRYEEVGAAYASLISWGLCVLFFPLIFSASKSFPRMFLRSFEPASWMRAVTG
jgi:O-antigen/teichoic acid export membrane protein